MKMKINTRYPLCLLLLFSEIASADFVIGSSCPSSSESYGNSQTAAFRSAVSGIKDPCAAVDEVTMPERDFDRYYLRGRLNYGTLIYDEVKNRSKSTNQNDFSTATVSRSRAIKNQSGFEIAVGYIWSGTTRGEIEYLANKNLSYKTNITLPGVNTQVTANFKNNTLLFNGYYEFTGMGRLKPYVTYGAGITDTSVKAAMTSSIQAFNDSQTTRNLRLAWQLGVGARLNLYPPRWSIDLSYRFIQLGNNVRTIPISNVQINGRYALSALSIGIVYLF